MVRNPTFSTLTPMHATSLKEAGLSKTRIAKLEKQNLPQA